MYCEISGAVRVAGDCVRIPRKRPLPIAAGCFVNALAICLQAELKPFPPRLFQPYSCGGAGGRGMGVGRAEARATQEGRAETGASMLIMDAASSLERWYT